MDNNARIPLEIRNKAFEAGFHSGGMYELDMMKSTWGRMKAWFPEWYIWLIENVPGTPIDTSGMASYWKAKVLAVVEAENATGA